MIKLIALLAMAVMAGSPPPQSDAERLDRLLRLAFRAPPARCDHHFKGITQISLEPCWKYIVSVKSGDLQQDGRMRSFYALSTSTTSPSAAELVVMDGTMTSSSGQTYLMRVSRDWRPVFAVKSAYVRKDGVPVSIDTKALDLGSSETLGVLSELKELFLSLPDKPHKSAKKKALKTSR